jgi:pimeloyl-ACP methyl ester carboxylesterase
MAVTEKHEQVGDVSVRWLEAPPAAGAAPVLYVHGVPNDGDIWLPFLERTGGVAPDLPGFGRSDKPPHFDYSIEGYGRFLREYADGVGLDRFSLVVHDWGAVGLVLAQELPDRIERLAIVDAVPFVPGYRWHRVASLWRTPLVGEMTMGFTFKRGLRRGMPGELVDHAYERFDHGTQRAILKLYRASPPGRLAAAGTRLGDIKAPALVAWGAADEYIPAKFAREYADRLGGEARVELIEGAGHWPWIDRPELVDTVARFLRGA